MPPEDDDNCGWTLAALNAADDDYWEQKEYEDSIPYPEPPSMDDPWWMGMRSDW
jgi:hypothetical protein